MQSTSEYREVYETFIEKLRKDFPTAKGKHLKFMAKKLTKEFFGARRIQTQ